MFWKATETGRGREEGRGERTGQEVASRRAKEVRKERGRGRTASWREV